VAQVVVIVGAGQAGGQAAAALRHEQFAGRIVVLGEEAHPPYQRPPLSKALLLGKTQAADTAWRPPAFYADNSIELRLGARADRIDREAAEIALEDGTRIPYDHLVLATGTRPRRIDVPGAGDRRILYLRTLDDSARLAAEIGSARRVVVVGGGFIGLEVAASARQLGCAVTVVEALPRLMARSVAKATSAAFRTLHETEGTRIELSTAVKRFESSETGLDVVTGAGTIEADLVLVGIGAEANDELATAAGLATARGILVDEQCRTADPRIFAVGDCAVVTDEAGFGVRLESVQNAVDQGRAVAAAIAGREPAPLPVPWFWSDQYGAKLQIAGLAGADDDEIVRGDPGSGRFSVFRYSGNTLRGVDSVSSTSDHMVARRLLGSGISPDPRLIADPRTDLKKLVAMVARPS
jgi:3-phenylpropionate/trans-cinnamate dioxygenase ferredoxin reductase subunit